MKLKINRYTMITSILGITIASALLVGMFVTSVQPSLAAACQGSFAGRGTCHTAPSGICDEEGYHVWLYDGNTLFQKVTDVMAGPECPWYPCPSYCN